MMLASLRVREYALVDDVAVDFGPGLNVLTGETGAGKSILVDALALLLGARASTEAIREGSDRAVVEGLFVEDGEESVVRREILRDRTNRCLLDGDLTTARALAELGRRRVELHGQHEDHLLLERGIQRELLDAFAGALELAADVAAAADRLAALEREARALAAAAAECAERMEWLTAQVEEIDGAAPRPGEEDELEAEARRLGNAEERGRLAAGAHHALEADERSIAGALAGLERDLERLARLDGEVEGWVERLRAARFDLADLGRELGRYADHVEHDPAALARVEERRALLHRLSRKHGVRSAEDLAETGRRLHEELEALRAEARRSRSLAEEQAAARRALAERANALADAREAAADRLEDAVVGRLRALGMGDGTFAVALGRRPDADGVERDGERWAWTRGGLEEVEFRIAPNPGEPARPLRRIASGGELSRTLLAIKAALAAADRTPTLVFDEIDAGIGGVVAHRVATELRAVARHHQVVVVTHLAQIAAAADRHLVVEKETRGGRSVTRARLVEGEARVREVSRLLGGDPERDVSRHHAEELLAGSG